ncbi:hypothetical protein [Bacillus canaveralius]|uniref:hypothetical protein n=1 Tax=Bacillus canaveralius TaxID=1403243 RepID=UPI0015E08F09|nr:hypothetical protein [Bacillus canaveralius]
MTLKKVKRSYPLWTELPYAGENRPPTNPVEQFRVSGERTIFAAIRIKGLRH